MMQMNGESRFVAALAAEAPLLLDGGLATQLETQGCDIDDPLWSAVLLLTQPDEIVSAHRAYIKAGAECIATASYQASREGFAQKGIDAHQADGLLRYSVELAQQAVLDQNREVLIAASLGPYGAMLHDGSEYRGRYRVPVAKLREFHAPRIAVLQDTCADVLAFETIPSAEEAYVLAELLVNSEIPAWVSFSCRDSNCISDGTPIAEVATQFADHRAVCAVGVNCTPPQFITGLLRRASEVTDLPLIAYPNSGEIYCAESNTWHGTAAPIDFAMAAEAWVRAGASAIGGCCRTGPEHVRAMSNSTS